VSKSKTGRYYNLSSSTLFRVVKKKKDKIKSAVLASNVPGGNKKLRRAEH
jgi:hypothetical protein